MTKSRFDAGVNMRLSCVAALALALGLSACGTGGFGIKAAGFDTPQVAEAYLPLHRTDWMLRDFAGAAVVIAPHVAVTNAHNANLVDAGDTIGKVKGYDLLYFRTDKTNTLPTGTPFEGEAVVAYGQDPDGNLRISRGTIHQFWPAAFGYVSDAGPGFSGGPVVDAKSGALLGITYGYEGDEKAKTRLMVAYDMAFVTAQFAALSDHAAAQ